MSRGNSGAMPGGRNSQDRGGKKYSSGSKADQTSGASHGPSQPISAKGNGKPKRDFKTLTCHGCGKPGHKIKHCRDPKKSQSGAAARYRGPASGPRGAIKDSAVGEAIKDADAKAQGAIDALRDATDEAEEIRAELRRLRGGPDANPRPPAVQVLLREDEQVPAEAPQVNLAEATPPVVYADPELDAAEREAVAEARKAAGMRENYEARMEILRRQQFEATTKLRHINVVVETIKVDPKSWTFWNALFKRLFVFLVIFLCWKVGNFVLLDIIATTRSVETAGWAYDLHDRLILFTSISVGVMVSLSVFQFLYFCLPFFDATLAHQRFSYLRDTHNDDKDRRTADLSGAELKYFAANCIIEEVRMPVGEVWLRGLLSQFYLPASFAGPIRRCLLDLSNKEKDKVYMINAELLAHLMSMRTLQVGTTKEMFISRCNGILRTFSSLNTNRYQCFEGDFPEIATVRVACAMFDAISRDAETRPAFL